MEATMQTGFSKLKVGQDIFAVSFTTPEGDRVFLGRTGDSYELGGAIVEARCSRELGYCDVCVLRIVRIPALYSPLQVASC
jgi:hypothetical protein